MLTFKWGLGSLAPLPCPSFRQPAPVDSLQLIAWLLLPALLARPRCGPARGARQGGALDSATDADLHPRLGPDPFPPSEQGKEGGALLGHLEVGLLQPARLNVEEVLLGDLGWGPLQERAEVRLAVRLAG